MMLDAVDGAFNGKHDATGEYEMDKAKELTFSKGLTAGAAAHADAFGYTVPEDVPWQLCWPSADPPPDRIDFTCNEYGELLAACVKRGKPVTVREYVDFFWKGEDGVYRGGVTKEIASRDYGEFVRRVSADEALL